MSSRGQKMRILEKLKELSDISHSETDSDGIWQVAWTAPSNDTGHVHFWLAGNSVNGDGAPGDEDWWNILSFTINSPDTIESGDSGATLETRTVSVGDYDTLFLIEESEAQRKLKDKRLCHIEFSLRGTYSSGPVLRLC